MRAWSAASARKRAQLTSTTSPFREKRDESDESGRRVQRHERHRESAESAVSATVPPPGLLQDAEASASVSRGPETKEKSQKRGEGEDLTEREQEHQNTAMDAICQANDESDAQRVSQSPKQPFSREAPSEGTGGESAKRTACEARDLKDENETFVP